MVSSAARLIIQHGPYEGKSYDLVEAQYVLGRSSGNDISLPDPEVSRQHLRLVRQVNGYAIEDMGSTNGTSINGRRFSGLTLLQNGDVIGLGETIQILYASGESHTSASTPVNLATALEPPTDPDLSPPPAARAYIPHSPPQSAVQYNTPPQPMPPVAPPLYLEEEEKSSSTRRVLGCGCGFLALMFFCVALFFFLDAYQGGQLLYCGPLRPFWEIVLGPFGFAPYCI